MRPVIVLAAAAALSIPAAAAAPPPSWRDFVRLGHHLFCGGGHGRYVALTFDDGPGPYTARLVSVLRRAHARATFFIIGNRVHYWRSSVAAELKLGALGNHTWSHPRLDGLTRRQIRGEIMRTQRELGTLGTYAFIFRPPYDRSTPLMDRVVRSLGLLDVRWSTDSRDALGAGYSEATSRVLDGLRPGAIILMHDAHPWTADMAAAAIPPSRYQLTHEGSCP
jgi:peptidoglycan/xylan/chitin deacetylase (PgdA/CDA1 family)